VKTNPALQKELAMKNYKYPVVAFRQQQDSPIQVAFVAYTAEVLEWAGVPRKSDELLTGYQRFIDRSRINSQIVPFFQDQHNSSPTSIVVALRRDSGLGRCTLEHSTVPPGEVVNTFLSVEIDDAKLETDDLYRKALEYVNNRLGNFTIPTDTPDDDSDEDGEEIVSEDDELDETEEITHLGTVTLERMKEFLTDESNWKKPEFRSAIIDYVKPAFIIDGQHRMGGAARIGIKGLPFLFCGLYDAPWEEQVFQFIVVNVRPKRISPSLITSIAGLSLTRAEQDRVEMRLKQAGVSIAEVTVMSLVAYDDASPFADKVDMQVAREDREGKLGYGSVKRITKEWYSASRTSITQIAKEIYDTSNNSKARRRWREERLWFDFFCLFWTRVRGQYSTELWEKASHNRLFVGAHLWALQEVILKEADGQVKSHWLIRDRDQSLEGRIELLKSRLLEVVDTTLEYFPEELWRMSWTKPSADTNAGRQDLVQFFTRFVDEGKKASGLWKNWKTKSELVKP